LSNWIADAYVEGLKTLDTDEILQKAATHITTKGEWETGVISPSLVGGKCALARVKKFLGHKSQPWEPRMAVRAGEPDPVSNLNFLRGFFMEGVFVAAMESSLGDRVIDKAPTFAPSCIGPCDMKFAGHPDMMVVGESGDLELIQIKSPSVYKMDRVKKYGRDDAMKNYIDQLVIEMYICRQSDIPIVRTNLVMISSEGTPSVPYPRIEVFDLEWDDSMLSIPQQAAEELSLALFDNSDSGSMPSPYPVEKWNTFPCSYCNYSRLGTFDKVACDEDWAWDMKIPEDADIISLVNLSRQNILNQQKERVSG
jgi:hypothetical protein